MTCIELIFSPTGGTRKVADTVAAALADEASVVDLADRSADFGAVEVAPDDIALVAMPCFGGRAPQIAMERLARVRGNGASCVVVSVYGNRAFDDALLEMADGAREAGFKVVAAIAAVAQHSIMPAYGAGRPSADDLAQLAAFGETVREAVSAGVPVEAAPIPGKRPYVKAGSVPLVPKYAGSCRRCGRCAADCPVGAIDAKTLITDKAACIACMRCIDECPDHARKVNGLLVKIAGLAIRKQARSPKENELFAAQ